MHTNVHICWQKVDEEGVFLSGMAWDGRGAVISMQLHSSLCYNMSFFLAPYVTNFSPLERTSLQVSVSTSSVKSFVQAVIICYLDFPFTISYSSSFPAICRE